MPFDPWTLAFEAVNFLVLVWLLHRFLFRPVLAAVERRRAAIADSMAEAETAREEARAEADSLRRERAAIAAERDALLAEARADIETERQRMREEARREKDGFLASARDALARDREAALDDLRERGTDLAVSLASTLLRKTVHGGLAEPFLEQLDARLASMPAADRERLFATEETHAAIAVTTAPALDGDRRSAWRRRFAERLGRCDAIAFDSDEGLIAGARIALPNAVLEASWRQALAAARRHIRAGDRHA